MTMVTTMFQSLIGCVVILFYLCMGVYIGLGWVRNLCDNTEIKKCQLPIIVFIAVMLMFFLVAYIHHHTYRQTHYAHCQRKETE